MFASQWHAVARSRPIIHICRLASTASDDLNHYQVLELPRNASLKEIKLKFKKLSKKYHPDLNSHLPEEEQDANSKKYVRMVLAYDTLKDVKKKKEYDSSLGARRSGSGHHPRHSRPSHAQEWQNKYYGEAKYHSRAKASRSYTSQGYNAQRHRVHNFYDGSDGSNPQLSFSGFHRNKSNRYDVPHFDYDEHLAKNLKFEQHIINKLLTPAERDAIIKQLSRGGDVSDLNDEVLTKHLMRRVSINQESKAPQKAPEQQSTNQFMYQRPQQQYGNGHDSLAGFGMTAAILVGGAGSVYLMFKALIWSSLEI